jgi:L-malate glycosyltransferase
LNILHLLAFRIWSGPAQLVYQLALNQRAAGHHVHVALDQTDDPIPAEEAARPYFKKENLLLPGNYCLSHRHVVRSMFYDLPFLANQNVDIIHSHTTHDHLLVSLALGWRRHRPKIIRSFHKPQRSPTPLLVTDALTLPYATFQNPIRKERPWEILPALVPKTYQPPTDKPALKQKLGYRRKISIGMVSTLKPSRNHKLGLRAFERLQQKRSDIELIIIGDGAQELALRDEAARIGIEEHLLFTGYKKGAAYIEALQGLDVAWILGLGNDWSGRAAAQARQCAVKVIAVNLGALPSFATLCVKLDAADIAQKTQRLLAQDTPSSTSATPHTTPDTTLLSLYQRA